MSRFLISTLLGALLRVLFRPRVQGVRHIPAHGPVILAGNHLAFTDSLFIALAAGRPVSFIGKAEYVTGRGLRGRLKAAFFRAAGMIPVDRDGAHGGVAALHTGRELLERGQVFGIHPEGTRSPDGRLYRGRTGLARLALSTGAPVVPCALIGTDRIQPPGTRLPRLRRIEVRFGEPLDFSRYQGMERDRYVLRAVTDEVMHEVMRLSGQEYVDVYATTVKRAA